MHLFDLLYATGTIKSAFVALLRDETRKPFALSALLEQGNDEMMQQALSCAFSRACLFIFGQPVWLAVCLAFWLSV